MSYRLLRGSWLGLWVVFCCGTGCEPLERWLFTRHAPEVDRAVTALKTEDAGTAASLLTEYLRTGRCQGGTLNPSETVRERPEASLDLGLALFQLAERYGQKFGTEPPPRTPQTPEQAQESQLLLRRSAEVDCAQRVVRVIAADESLPIELRAEAYYLSGNLEFLRHEYRAAVDSYDAALALIPGGMGDAGPGVGTRAAWNRAIALRRAEEEEQEPPTPPDAGANHSDAGSESQDQDGDQQSDDSKEQEQPPNQDEQDEQQDKQEEQQNEQESSKQEQEQEQPSPEQDSSKGAQSSKDEQEPKEPPPEQNRPSLSQDEQVLQMLERAPMLQHELPKIRGARGRPSMEDK